MNDWQFAVVVMIAIAVGFFAGFIAREVRLCVKESQMNEKESCALCPPLREKDRSDKMIQAIQMYKCNSCGAIFGEDEFPTIDGEVSAVYAGGEKIHSDKKPEVIEQCPECRSEDFEDVYECENCGEYTPLLYAKEGKGGPAICDDCARSFESMTEDDAKAAAMNGPGALRNFHNALALWSEAQATETQEMIDGQEEK